MGHLGDVLHALLTADDVLTDVTQWSSFPRASCFSLVAHTLATAPKSAEYNNFRRKKKKQQCKVGREEEGSSSNRPELEAFFLALCDTLIEEPLLYLCDNQSLLKAVTRWIGEGGKATLVFWQQPSKYYKK